VRAGSLARSVELGWRFARLQLGLLLFGVGIATLLGAAIGLDPWSTFHEGLATRAGLSFGRITQGVGLLLIAAAWLAFRERPGLGTVCNMALIGPWVDLFRPHLETAPDGPAWWGVVQFLVGVSILGLASGTYISARLGAGPRDAFILGASRRLRISIRSTRMALEALVLAIGWLLGGPIGLGTVLFVLLMGPLMQFWLRVFRYDNGTTSITAPRSAAREAE
jgi:uncharacterized membrane protein YczE